MLNKDSAAILCSHVASGTHPILLAIRTDPENKMDSGWQFLCNTTEDENWNEAKIWSIAEVLNIEPSLEFFIEYPSGTNLVRVDIRSKWQSI